jgi:hypothetical protein
MRAASAAVRPTDTEYCCSATLLLLQCRTVEGHSASGIHTGCKDENEYDVPFETYAKRGRIKSLASNQVLSACDESTTRKRLCKPSN